MAGASFTPDILWEDSYFDEKRPLTRRERVLWIAANIRRTDNCVAKKGEGAWSLRFLEEAWRCPKTTVERFLKKCEKLGILVLKKCKINGTVQYVITYLFSTLSAFSQKEPGQQVGQERDRSGTNFKSEDGSKSEPKGSCGASAPRFGFPDLDETLSTVDEAVTPSPKKEAPRARKPAAPKSPDGYPEDFKQAWDASPAMARKRSSQLEAYAEWRKLNEAERERVMAAIAVWPHDKYAKGLHLWLKKRRWESLLETTVQRKPAAAASSKRNWAEADA